MGNKSNVKEGSALDIGHFGSVWLDSEVILERWPDR